jgi:hypothetical protein
MSKRERIIIGIVAFILLLLIILGFVELAGIDIPMTKP